MTDTKNYYMNSELALAAYAELRADFDDNRYLEELREAGLSPTQATNFTTRWRVIDQYDGKVEQTYIDEFGQEHTYLRSTGLSVTVFENIDNGRRYLAIRGTEGVTDLQDLWTDFTDISLLGTPERQAQYAALRDKVAEWLGNGTLSSGFTVSGHSLGGFLAGALLVDYPSEIGHAYLYNAPGVGGLSAGLRLLAGLETEPTLDLSKVSNLIAEAGPSLVAGLGLDWGDPIAVPIEDQNIPLEFSSTFCAFLVLRELPQLIDSSLFEHSK